MQKKIAFIGAGNMTTSFIGGLIADGYDHSKIFVSNPTEQKLKRFKESFKVNVSTDNISIVKQADVVVLAVKPRVLHEVAVEIKQAVQESKPLVISIAAGIRASDLLRWLGGKVAIVKGMPNTPALIRCSATAMYANEFVMPVQHEMAESIMRAIGMTMWFDNEKLIDSVTALSGSGPAYFFLVMEALEQAAETVGLRKEDAHLLTLQTAIGAARLALESGESLAKLCSRVETPGGVTEQSIRELEAGGLRQLFAHALQESNRRAEEIADMYGQQE